MLEKIKEEFQKDITFEINEISSFSLKIPSIYKKYLDMMIEAKKILDKKKAELKNLYAHKYIDYKVNSHISFKTKAELDDIIAGDDEYIAKKNEVDEWSSIVQYLERALDIIRSLSYTIKNIIEWEKFRHGI